MALDGLPMITGNASADQKSSNSSQTYSASNASSLLSSVCCPPRDETLSPVQHEGAKTTLPYPSMPAFDASSSSSPSGRSKRVQCKNACTNCQKACKKCDDSRPCQRCIRNGCLDTCVDSKRKERKKGLKRGPYKKRDGRSLSAGDAGNDTSPQATHGAHLSMPHLPYVGPVAYPLWGTYFPGPGSKWEGMRFFQPVFTFSSVGGLPHNGEEVGSVTGGSETPYIPIGFFPTTFISYPGPFQPYPVLQGHGTTTPGSHLAYPLSGMSTTHLPKVNVAASEDNGTSSLALDTHARDSTNNLAEGSGKGKERSYLQVNDELKVVKLPAKKAAKRKAN